MSLPPPSSAPPGSGSREHTIALEPSRSWGRRRGGEGSIKLSPLGAVISHTGLLHEPLRLPLGTLQLGLVEPGPAKIGGQAGRFPVLKRLSPTAVVPRQEGIEGWLWTSTGGSGLTQFGHEDDAPNAALVFTKPLGGDIVASFVPDAAEEIAARSALGAPAIYGLLFRVVDHLLAERVFRQYGLLRPLTDREVPPTLRRSLPTDRSADPTLGVAAGAPRESAISVAPPGMG
jgi:hypothetical protein